MAGPELDFGEDIEFALNGNFYVPTDILHLPRSLGSLVLETYDEGDPHPENTLVYRPEWSPVVAALQLDPSDEGGPKFVSLKVSDRYPMGYVKNGIKVRASTNDPALTPGVIVDVKLGETYPTRFYPIDTSAARLDAQMRTAAWARMFFSRQA